MDVGVKHRETQNVFHARAHTQDSTRGNLLVRQTYLASSTTSTSARSAIWVLEGTPRGSSMFSSPLVEFITCPEKKERNTTLTLMPGFGLIFVKVARGWAISPTHQLAGDQESDFHPAV